MRSQQSAEALLYFFPALLAKELSDSAVKFDGLCKPNVAPSLGVKKMNVGDKLMVIDKLMVMVLYADEEKNL
jgi:hypothetical protein